MDKAKEIISRMKDVFDLSGEGFEGFFEECEKKSSGDYSTSASSGCCSTSASSGNDSKSASSGCCSTSASSGDGSTSASSGDGSTSASSGNNSTSASSGNDSKSASSGDGSTSASSGYGSTSASSGDGSTSASSGDGSTSASSGDYSKSASSGNDSKSASSGDYSKSASSGDYSTSASSGNDSKSASSGNYSKSTSSGYGSQSASSGNYSKSASSGDGSACSALGYQAAVKGDLNNLVMCSEYKNIDGELIPVGGKASLVDGDILKPDCWYIVENGGWVEVDFSDNIFTYVISKKGNVSKVKTNEGKILYIVRDEEGNSAHGKSIKEAKEELVYKVSDRDTSKYDNLSLDSEVTHEEAIKIYITITGACSAGVKNFIDSNTSEISDTYKISQLIELTKGQYGHDIFSYFFKK